MYEMSSRINKPVLRHKAVQQLLHDLRMSLCDQVLLQITEVSGLHQHLRLAISTKEGEHCLSNLQQITR